MAKRLRQFAPHFSRSRSETRNGLSGIFHFIRKDFHALSARARLIREHSPRVCVCVFVSFHFSREFFAAQLARSLRFYYIYTVYYRILYMEYIFAHPTTLTHTLRSRNLARARHHTAQTHVRLTCLRRIYQFHAAQNGTDVCASAAKASELERADIYTCMCVGAWCGDCVRCVYA